MVRVASVREPGPWTHKNVSAAGSSFHVVEAGTGPHTVLLLHDFPLFWWSWRHQLPALAAAGYRAAAVDLRGFGGSDYAPGEVSLARLATDVSAVAQSLGAGSYSLVGAGMGGAPAWMVAHGREPALKSLFFVASPHPRSRSSQGAQRHKMRSRKSLYWRLPRRGPRQLQDGSLVAELLGNWPAPGNVPRVEEQFETYAEPMRRHFAAEAAWQTFEATRKVRLAERHRYAAPISVPVWSVRGTLDRHCTPLALADDPYFVENPLRQVELADCGHYVSEEQPAALTDLLLEHLEEIGAPR